jgi:uncharacterized phiE125 gp8 family phage protein
MGWVQTTAPASEPVTTAEFKSFAKVDISDDDTLIAEIIKGSRQWCEDFQNRAYVNASWTLDSSGFPSSNAPLELHPSPLSSITSIKYYDLDNTLQTWSTSNYEVDTSVEPGRIRPVDTVDYPDTYDRLDAIEVIYVCGEGSSGSSVPEREKIAVKQLGLQMYDMRTPQVTGAALHDVKFTVESLLWPRKITIA